MYRRQKGMRIRDTEIETKRRRYWKDGEKKDEIEGNIKKEREENENGTRREREIKRKGDEKEIWE